MKRCNVWSDYGEDEEDAQPCKKKLKNIEETSSESDSSDDEDAEICAICLGKLYKSQVGSPEGCDHVFCLKCILEWSKNVNTCPVDRIPFQIIFARESMDDNTAVIINVENKDKRVADESDVTVCETCNLGDREDRLLLCDGCNKGYHLECLTPPLLQVPVGDWYCEDCEASGPGPSHARSNRMIARTLIYQRVMRNIRQVTDSSDDDSEEDANDSEDDSEEEEVAEDGEVEECRTVQNILKKAKQTSSTKSKRKKKSSSTKGRSKKRRGSRRKKRKKSRRRAKRSLPCLFGETSRSKGSKYQFEQNSLSIFGNRLSLHSFKDDIPASSPSKVEKSNDSSRASRSMTKEAKEDKKSFDILGDILNGQALLHSRSSDVVIGRDGRLKPLKPLPDMRLQEGKQPSSSFFLRDICASSSSSSSVASPSVSSTSSPKSSTSARNGRYDGPSRSRYSDFSDSSNDSYPGPIQLGPSYEESYSSLAREARSKTRGAKNEATASKDAKFPFDRPGEYSPICNDDDDCEDGNSRAGMETNVSLEKSSAKAEALASKTADGSESRKSVKLSEDDLSKQNIAQFSSNSCSIKNAMMEVPTNLQQEHGLKSEVQSISSSSNPSRGDLAVGVSSSLGKGDSFGGTDQTVTKKSSKCDFLQLGSIGKTPGSSITRAVKNIRKESDSKRPEKDFSRDLDFSKSNPMDVGCLESLDCKSRGPSSSSKLEAADVGEEEEEEEGRPPSGEMEFDEDEEEEEEDDSKMEVEFHSRVSSTCGGEVNETERRMGGRSAEVISGGNQSTACKEDKAKKLAFVEKLMQESLRSYYVNGQINKDDYKHIMKKGVSKIMKSRDKRIEPQKVKKFVDQYVLSMHKRKLP